MRTGKWASATHNRDQLMLLSPTLDEMIPMDHRIRRFEELTLDVDWSDWEASYHRDRGQPPIHPRLLAGAILYGLTERVRTSRELEEATKVRLDFKWFLENRTIDHSTFAKFRTDNTVELKSLFKDLALRALKNKVCVELSIDGTRIRSNSSRTGARTGKKLEERAAELAAELSSALDKMEQADILDDPNGYSAEKLTQEIERLRKEQGKLHQALKEARKRDKAKARSQVPGCAKESRIPVADPDSYILNNKEGGFAPNYTPTTAIDTESGAILSTDIPEGHQEGSVVSGAVSHVVTATGNKPERVLFDSGFAAGENLKYLEDNEIEAYSSAGFVQEDNPAIRQDPSVPVPADQVHKLPKKKVRKIPVFTREAFIYDQDNDCYWCPMGRTLPRCRVQGRTKGDLHITIYEYQSKDCSKCPYRDRCLSSKKKTPRKINRDEFQSCRENLVRRMECEESRTTYKRRSPVSEGAFGCIKHNMGIRQFLLRGHEKVKTEWTWICAAYNVGKILRQMAT